MTKMPQTPNTTLGMAASISIIEMAGCRTQPGASSVK